jgi:hypothetical protein
MPTGGGTTEESAGFLPLALLLSSLGVIGFTLFGMFCLAAFLVWRIFLNRPAPSFAPPPPRFPRYEGTPPRGDATKPRLPPEDQLPGGIY